MSQKIADTDRKVFPNQMLDSISTQLSKKATTTTCTSQNGVQTMLLNFAPGMYLALKANSRVAENYKKHKIKGKLQLSESRLVKW